MNAFEWLLLALVENAGKAPVYGGPLLPRQ